MGGGSKTSDPELKERIIQRLRELGGRVIVEGRDGFESILDLGVSTSKFARAHNSLIASGDLVRYRKHKDFSYTLATRLLGK